MKKVKKSIIIMPFLLLGMLVLSACEEPNDNDADDDSENFPEQDIDIIAGGGPGGGTDVFARAVGRELSDILDVNVNIVNQPGAAGSVASQELDSKPSDGYTIMPTTTDFSINIASGRTENYLDKFDALARLHQDTYLLFVKEDSEISDFETLIEKAEENPGEITVGGTHSDGLDELTVHSFEEEADIDLNYTPYEESGKIRSDLTGGHVDVMIDQLGASGSLVEGGEIKPLVVFADDRVEDFPDIPTTTEEGVDLTDGLDRGFVVKNDVPEGIKEKLANALEEAFEKERYQEFVEEQELDLKDAWLDGEEYDEELEKDVDKYESLLE